MTRRARSTPPAVGKPGKIVGPEPVDESEHFMKCPVCGAMFDMRDIGQVLEHDGEHEGPLKN